MAVAAQKTITSLMQKTIERQTTLARRQLKFSKGQVEKIIVNYVRNGNSATYSELIKVLQDYPISDENYRIVFDDCLSCVVILGRELKPFVDTVCNIEWASRSDELVDLYSRFVLSLVTANTYHCDRVITNLLKLFKADVENCEEDPNPERVKIWSNIHTIIAEIIAVMPMASELLMQIVVEQFPYYKAGCHVNRAYIHNLIWMSKYLPLLREQIMTAIVKKMVDMDVNIVEREKTKAQHETVFDMEVDEPDEVAEALDFSMLEMLRWLEEERDPVLNVLGSVFEKVILPTDGIRHVQFLLLYTISINQQCADRVLNNLWLVAAGLQGLSPGAFATRRTAASHLAGLLARCVRVPNSRLIYYLRAMAEWCHAYITASQESTAASDNMKTHGPFHAICHAIFYLIAFKHLHLFTSKENLNFVESLNLPRLVTSPLNPLRTCPPQVTRAFSSVTRAHQVVYCQPIVEKNSRHSLHAGFIHSDEWFPYDPYTLPRSGKIIWPLCIEYKDWLKGGDDETQYSGMKRKLEAEDDDFLTMASPSQRLASSLSNCISPGFRTSENTLM